MYSLGVSLSFGIISSPPLCEPSAPSLEEEGEDLRLEAPLIFLWKKRTNEGVTDDEEENKNLEVKMYRLVCEINRPSKIRTGGLTNERWGLSRLLYLYYYTNDAAECSLCLPALYLE